MTSKQLKEQLKELLIKWSGNSNAIYMTDEETGPEGVIVSEEIVCSVKELEGKNVIYYKGKNDHLNLLEFYLFENNLDIEIIQY